MTLIGLLIMVVMQQIKIRLDIYRRRQLDATKQETQKYSNI